MSESPWTHWWHAHCTLRTKVNIRTLQGILPKLLLWERVLAKNQIFPRHLAVTFPARTHTARIRHVWSLGSTMRPISSFSWCLFFPKPFYKLQNRSARFGITSGRLGLNPPAGKGAIIFKKQGLRKWQLDTGTTPLGATGEGRLLEVPLKNKRVKSDALLKSKAGDCFQALCAHVASDRQNLALLASSADYTGYHTWDGFWSLVIMWMTFQNDSLDLGLWVQAEHPQSPWKSMFAPGKPGTE